MEVDSQTIVVKLTYDGQMRRFPFEGTSFNALHQQIVQLLALGNGTDLVLKYTDEEGDLITISSDLELKSAVSPGNLLRISVLRKPSVDSMGATPTPQEPVSVGDLDFTFKGLGFEQGCNPHGWGHARRGQFSKEEWEMLKKHKKERKMFKHQEFGPYAHHGPHHGHHHGRGPRCFPPGPHGFPPGPPFGFPPGPHGFGFPHGGPHSPHGHHHERHGGRHGPHGPHGNNEKADRLFARFAKDVTIEDGYLLAPNVPFVKTWRLRNEGSVAWPTGSVLRFVGKHSDNMGGPEFVPVEPIAPGEEVDISVNLCSPSKPGRYTGYWRMCTADEKKFGQRVWVSIIVPADGTSSSESDKEADKLEALVDIVLGNEQLRSLGIKRHKVYRLLKRCGGDIDKVMEIMNKKVAKRMKKMEKCKN